MHPPPFADKFEKAASDPPSSPKITKITKIRHQHFLLLALIKDALGRTWPHFLLKYVFISASKGLLADIFTSYFCDAYTLQWLKS